MKKQLNVDQIQSELRGGSAFFPGYKGGGSPTPPSKASKKTTIGGNTRTPSTGSTQGCSMLTKSLNIISLNDGAT
jgi:hypothetical protein